MANATPKNPLSLRRYGDVVLAFGVMAIMCLMVLRLPTAVIDGLVAMNIACGVALLLIALCVPHPVAFNSFPSVLLITTLFRLSLSVATTRLILLDAHAGHIIDAFGNFVAGGNLVVGIVVFIIITIVQFMVIAKGAERVAEVAARFTLDAMPGKQLSIDSDLRSGLIDKDEAKRRRSLLERESQLNGSLDGAMKFVKGDSIASIIIVIVNLLGGLTVGVLQKGMGAGEAMQLYSILTIGDGMVAQIPALLSAMAAGLIVTRSAGDDDKDGHLGDTIARQITAHPRALMMTGFISLMLALVPGFPSLIFIALAAGAFVLAKFARGSQEKREAELEFARGGSGSGIDKAARPVAPPVRSGIAPALMIEIGGAVESVDLPAMERKLSAIVTRSATDLGIRFPSPVCAAAAQDNAPAWRIVVFDVPVATAAAGSTFDAAVLERELTAAVARNADQFIGVQDVTNLLEAAAEQYPALVKEVLRQVPTAQKIAEVLRNLVREGIPLRNLRDVFEALAEWGGREKDSGALTEFVRIHLRRYMTNRYSNAQRQIDVLVVDGAVEEAVRRSLTETPAGVMFNLPPQSILGLRNGLRTELERLGMKDSAEGAAPLVITAADVRRHIRKILEPIHARLSVLSYQELLPDVEVRPLGIVRISTETA